VDDENSYPVKNYRTIKINIECERIIIHRNRDEAVNLNSFMNDEILISSIVYHIVVDGYLGQSNYRVISKVKT
jgi:hypothetical protein